MSTPLFLLPPSPEQPEEGGGEGGGGTANVFDNGRAEFVPAYETDWDPRSAHVLIRKGRVVSVLVEMKIPIYSMSYPWGPSEPPIVVERRFFRARLCGRESTLSYPAVYRWYFHDRVAL